MIETPTAVANAYDIASVPGVDVVIVGNNDLSVFSGFPQSDPRYALLINKNSRRRAAGREDLRRGQCELRHRPVQQGCLFLPERSLERWLEAPTGGNVKPRRRENGN